MAGAAVDAPYILRCQEDSHLRDLRNVAVLACETLSPEELARLLGPEKKKKGKKQAHAAPSDEAEAPPQPRFRVRLANTVLFPEGGGQPYDLGALAAGEREVQVLRVHRDEEGATWHYTAEAVQAGQTVDVRLDWERRLDHMQCHSGQHLLTAVALRELGQPTGSWSLTSWPEPCYLDLEGPPLSAEQLALLEDKVNAEVMANRSMEPTVYSPDEFKALDDVRLKVVPDSAFPVRVVRIDGLDVNPCCGTHVKTTAELQLIKLVRNEPQGGTANRLYFVAGERARKLTQQLLDVSRGLTDRLSAGMPQHVDRVTTLVAAQKSATRAIKSLQGELAAALAPTLLAKAKAAGSHAVFYHCREGTTDFSDLLAKAVLANADPEHPIALFASTGDDNAKGPGAYLVISSAPEKLPVEAGSNAVKELLGARGGGKGAKFQGKVPAGALTTKALEAAQAAFLGAVVLV